MDGDLIKAEEASTEVFRTKAASNRRIVVWRPARRIRDRHPISHAGSLGKAVELPASSDRGSRTSVQRSGFSHRSKEADAGVRGNKRGGSGPLRGNRLSANDERGGDADRVHSGSFDANSPFAKLAELRALLLQNEKRGR